MGVQVSSLVRNNRRHVCGTAILEQDYPLPAEATILTFQLSNGDLQTSARPQENADKVRTRGLRLWQACVIQHFLGGGPLDCMLLVGPVLDGP